MHSEAMVKTAEVTPTTAFVNVPNSSINTLTPAVICRQSVSNNAKIEAWYRGAMTFALFYAIFIIQISGLADLVDNAEQLL